MSWKTLLAYIPGSADQELRLWNEYLVTESRILRQRGGIATVTYEPPERSTLKKLHVIEEE